MSHRLAVTSDGPGTGRFAGRSLPTSPPTPPSPTSSGISNLLSAQVDAPAADTRLCRVHVGDFELPRGARRHSGDGRREPVGAPRASGAGNDPSGPGPIGSPGWSSASCLGRRRPGVRQPGTARRAGTRPEDARAVRVEPGNTGQRAPAAYSIACSRPWGRGSKRRRRRSWPRLRRAQPPAGGSPFGESARWALRSSSPPAACPRDRLTSPIARSLPRRAHPPPPRCVGAVRAGAPGLEAIGRGDRAIGPGLFHPAHAETPRAPPRRSSGPAGSCRSKCNASGNGTLMLLTSRIGLGGSTWSITTPAPCCDTDTLTVWPTSLASRSSSGRARRTSAA